MGTFVQPNLSITNNNNNSSSLNNKSTITVVQAPNGFREIKVDEDNSADDVPMVVINDMKSQQRQTAGGNHSVQLVGTDEKSSSEKKRQQTPMETNNNHHGVVKIEDCGEIISSPPSPSSSFIDINSLPMVFDDTKLFENVSTSCTCICGPLFIVTRNWISDVFTGGKGGIIGFDLCSPCVITKNV